MSGIGPGDVVVCVDDSPCTSDKHFGIVPCPWRKGEVGRVVSVYRHGLELLPEKGSHTYIAARRFRKIRPASDEFTASIRACKPIRKREDA